MTCTDAQNIKVTRVEWETPVLTSAHINKKSDVLAYQKRKMAHRLLKSTVHSCAPLREWHIPYVAPGK